MRIVTVTCFCKTSFSPEYNGSFILVQWGHVVASFDTILLQSRHSWRDIISLLKFELSMPANIFNTAHARFDNFNWRGIFFWLSYTPTPNQPLRISLVDELTLSLRFFLFLGKYRWMRLEVYSTGNCPLCANVHSTKRPDRWASSSGAAWSLLTHCGH